MRWAILSDLHLGATTQGADVARAPEARERLVDAVGGADAVALLGDVVELRDQPLHGALDAARPVLQALGEACAGKRVVVVPGNHDHQLADPWLARSRLDGERLDVEAEWPVEPGDGILARIAEWMPEAELSVAYPGFRPRPDVYATHGHYLDLHLTVPRLESIALSLAGRAIGARRRPLDAAGYEAVASPLYALLFGIAQGASPGALARGSGFSRAVWLRTADHGGSRASRFLLGQVTIPGAVALLNRAGLGPFNPGISGAELRSAGLRAMGEVVRTLGVSADHVLFGHTHRPGPLPGDDDAEWQAPGGARLWNSGSWLHEPALVRPGQPSPYRPGVVAYLDAEGPPRLDNVLADLPLPAVG